MVSGGLRLDREFVALVLGRYRTAQVIAALAIVPDLVWLSQGEFTGAFQAPSGPLPITSSYSPA